VPQTIDACYVPASGTIYRVKAPNTPAACLSAAHVPFSWNRQGPKGDKGEKGEPGGAAGIGPDLTLPGALSVGRTGQFGGGLLATNGTALAVPNGAGTRLMWIPQKGAFRAGGATGTEWNEANVGQYSAAFGYGTTASGQYSTAAGYASTALGTRAVALGYTNRASGDGATALGAGSHASGPESATLGVGAVASGYRAVAIGTGTTASGANSMALGTGASTDGKQGAFVYGDASTGATVSAQANHEFVVRASGGVRLRTSSDLTRGCDVTTAGALACTGGIAAGAVQRLTGEWAEVPRATIVQRALACPPGLMIIGGGVETTGDNTVPVISRSYPDYVNNRWIGRVGNEDVFTGGGVLMRLYAICMR
jgi:hypothetical protein